MAEKKIAADKKAEEAVKEVKAEVKSAAENRSKGNKGKEGNCKESS